MSAGMWRPAHGHCAAVLSCPGRCVCSEELKAELEAERALLDAGDDGGTEGQPEAQNATEPDSGRLRTIYGLVAAMKLRGNQ